VHASPLRLVCVFLYGSRQFLDWSAIIFSNLLARLRKVNGSAATIEAYAIRMHKKRIGAVAIYSAFLRFWENTRGDRREISRQVGAKEQQRGSEDFSLLQPKKFSTSGEEIRGFIGITGVMAWPPADMNKPLGYPWPVRNSRVVSQPGNGDKGPIPSGQDACRRKLRP
jgi:hypothetical protein